MGVDKNERSTKKKQGSLLNGKGLQTTGTSFDWGSVDANRLSRLIALVTGRGGAIRFGYSRDGNAGSIGVYYAEDRDTVYIRPNGDLEETLSLIESTFENLPYSGGKSPSQ